MKIFFITFISLFFVACSTTYPAITQYRIATPDVTSEALAKSCKKETLKVSQVFVKSSLMSKKMKYIVGAYKEYAYNESEWAEQPNKALSDVIVTTLQDAGIFANVVSYKSFSSSDYTLETNVAAFTQHFTADEKHSFVKIAMSFSLIDNATGLVVASKDIVKTKETQNTNAQSGVIALNELLTVTLREMQIWIAKSCK